MAGSTTTTDHMPTPPMVDSVTATASRSQEAVESIATPGVGVGVDDCAEITLAGPAFPSSV
jgi:hypothetical protein